MISFSAKVHTAVGLYIFTVLIPVAVVMPIFSIIMDWGGINRPLLARHD
jgi:hypothetical protein